MSEHVGLRFDWDDVADSCIVDILGRNGRPTNDGFAYWDEVAICIEGRSILLSVEINTDQIEITLGEIPGGADWKPICSFSFAIGKSLGWCWIGQNYLGYQDSFMLAFGDVVSDALHPRCMFLAEGSSLCCFDLGQRKA
jgi:hypothetical protein